MDNLHQNSFIPAKVYDILRGIRIGSWDFEGASIPTEVVMQGSFKYVLASNGVFRDIYDIEKETSGHGLDQIFETFKINHKLDASVANMLDMRRDIYLKIVDDYELTLFPFVKPVAKFLHQGGVFRQNGAEQFFLSNGDHKAIKKIAGDAGVFPRYIDRIYASDSPERLKFAEERGLNKGDKAAFLAAYSIEKMVPPFKILLVEDNHRHIESTQKQMREAWGDLLSRKPSVSRETGVTEEKMEVQEFYVLNEFNGRHNFMPNTGVVFSGFAPKNLCQALGM